MKKLANAEPLSKFEIGRVYRSKSNRHYLAMDEDLIVSLYANNVIERHILKPGWEVLKDISSEELCAVWGVKLEEMDVMAAVYLNPRKPENRTRNERGRITPYIPEIYRIAPGIHYVD